MIKKLQRKFILAAMLAIVIVLEGIICSVNILDYYRLVSNADEMIALISDEDSWDSLDPGQNAAGDQAPEQTDPNAAGRAIPQADDTIAPQTDDTIAPQTDAQSETTNPEENSVQPPSDNENKLFGGLFSQENSGLISAETPYETRFFTVTLDDEGTVLSVDTDHIAAVSESEAESFATAVFAKNSEKGFSDIYRYNMSATEDGGYEIIFLDCRMNMNTVHNFTLISFGISTLGLLAVFVLVLIFSRMVFRPVAESYDKQKQFITDASHELKTPLTIIDANTEVLEMENGESQWSNSIHRQVKRLNALTQQLITLSKMDEGKIRGEKNTFSMSDMLGEILETFEAPLQMGKKKLQLQIQKDISFYGEEKSVRQMFNILVDNAAKYAVEDSEIRVSLQKVGNRILFEMSNRGNDIPKGNINQVFERFYRLDAARNSEQGGSGIGLAVAQAVVEAHRGKITARGLDGNVFLITIILPVNKTVGKTDGKKRL